MGWLRTLASLLVLSASAGCGIDTPQPSAFDVDAATSRRTDAGVDAGQPSPRDAGGARTPDVGLDAWAPPQCASTCSSDAQCAATCGAVPGGGVRCCDVATSRCFVSHTAVCPTPGGSWIGNDSGLFHRPDTDVDADTDAACVPPAPAATEVAVTALGLPGATLTLESSWYGTIATGTFDATGSLVVVSTQLSIGLYSHTLSLVDPIGFPVIFRIHEGTTTADVYPACIAPDPGSVQPLDHVDVVLQRDLATGLCAGSVLSVTVDCISITGEYTPSHFDDAPCGPFAAAP